MKYIEFQNDYSKKKEFKYALFSDLHLDAKHCEQEKLKRNLDYCNDNYDGILFNGDVFSALLPKDLKRFTLAHAASGQDNILDEIIDDVTEFLKPYAKKIIFIGMGNHETSVLRYHGTNPIARLCRQLKDYGSNAKFGDYQNLIRFKFNNGAHDAVRKFDLWSNHGMGAGAKRSRGVLEWDIVYSKFDADLYWQGHNHQGGIDTSGSYTKVNQVGKFVTKRKSGIRTPSWEEAISVRDYDAPYDLKYGEERHGMPVALPQFGLLELSLVGGVVKDQISLRCM